MRVMRLKHWGARLALVVLGLAAGLSLIEAGMRTAGWLIRAAQTYRNQQALRQRHEYRILCLGESTTAGNAEHGRYPEMLEQILNRQDLGVQVAVINRGQTGGSSRHVVGSLDKDLNEFEPNLVVVMMGINDIGKTPSYGSIIAPGAERWYGSFRLYKLYRMIRFELDHDFEPFRDSATPTLRPANTDAGERRAARPPLSAAQEKRLHEIRDRIGRQEYDGAREMLEHLLAEDSDVPEAYIELAQVYERTGRAEEGHQVLLDGTAAMSAPSEALYVALAHSHFREGNPEEAIRTMRFVIDSLAHPADSGKQIHYRAILSGFYEHLGEHRLAEELFLEIVEQIDPGNDITYQLLVDFYERRGDRERAAHHRRVQERIRHEYVSPAVRRNYLGLKEKLLARGISMVAVQYPARRVETLKEILQHDVRITYVDNRFFREFAEGNGYFTYFTDRFAGDFGHLTRAGNRLLARSVARAITERVFGLPFEDGEDSPAKPSAAFLE
jgi:tetratricopeptide (TPR) repeat protein